MSSPSLTVGLLLIGIFVNTYLFGLVSHHYAIYFDRGAKDGMAIKVMVSFLLFLDTLHTIVGIYSAWQVCVIKGADPAQFKEVTWTIPFTAVATGVSAIITQFFLNCRVYMLTKSKTLFFVILILSIVSLAFSVAAGIQSGIIRYVANFAPLKPLAICWLGFQTVTDALITSVLIRFYARLRTGFRSTDSVLNKLIRGAIQTGLVASILALADLFTFVFFDKSNLYTMFVYPLGRVYSTTLLHTLNSRTSLSYELSRHTPNDTTVPRTRRNPGTTMRTTMTQADMLDSFRSSFEYAPHPHHHHPLHRPESTYLSFPLGYTRHSHSNSTSLRSPEKELATVGEVNVAVGIDVDVENNKDGLTRDGS